MHNNQTTPVTATQSVAEYIATHQAIVNKSDLEVAQEIAFTNANVLTMIKQGKVKLPFDKIAALAMALDVSASDLLHQVLSDYEPTISAIAAAIWPASDYSHNERELIASYRHLSKGRDVAPLVMDGQSIIALVVA